MAPLRGWSPRGERLPAKVPHGHWRTITFLAALRHDRVEAPWLIDGPINGERFRLDVEKVLPGPSSQATSSSWTISARTRESRTARPQGGRRPPLFLPKYSPDLNPIELFFSKLKHWLRKAAGRTADAVYNAIAQIFETDISPECANYFAHAGYGQT